MLLTNPLLLQPAAVGAPVVHVVASVLTFVNSAVEAPGV
jgi:hypothetical protein